MVTNLTRFGAFIDIGVKQDGLVHVSEISHEYISDPSEKLKLNQKVMVKVLEVDLARKRISLSIKQADENGRPERRPLQKPAVRDRPGARPAIKENQGDISSLNMNDALALLKKKFGK
jgi:uncharacterized protein